MNDKFSVIKEDQSENVETTWCMGAEKEALVSKEVIPDSTQQHNFEQESQRQPYFTEMIRTIFYGEEKEQRDEKPDKIEAHRLLMEGSRELVTKGHNDVETKGHHSVEERTKGSMLLLANQTLDENQIINRYLSPGTHSNNSAMLFFAGTLFSSNQYIFELLNENGVFNPSSQKLVLALSSKFATQSKELCNALLEAERSSGAAIQNAVVSCVNDFVSTSDELAKVLEQDMDATAATVGAAKEVSASILNNIIAKRNQISSSLYEFFQRTVAVEKSIVSASASSAAYVSKELGDSVRFLADAEKFSNFLYAGMNPKKFACGNVDDISNNSRIDAKRKNKSKKGGINTKNKNTRDSDGDILSTASSFLNFINESSLSFMFEEDEQSNRDTGKPEAHLDAIFKRMNLKIPQIKKEKVAGTHSSPSSNWSCTPPQTTIKVSARERRRQMIKARSQARHKKKKEKKDNTRRKFKELQRGIGGFGGEL